MDAPLIAVIDDDESLRVALEGLLRALGYQARVFASAEDFLAADVAEQSRVIVTDIHLPGRSGLDLAHLLALQGCRTPLIMITARTEPGLETAARDAGAACFLRKPFDAGVLDACLANALARKS